MSRFVDKPRIAAQLLRGLFVQYGWLKSLREGRPVDAEGNPVPWFSFPAIDFIRQFDYTGKSVFEWGAGNSTRFWASRAERVVSVENHPEWYAYLKPVLPANCELILSAPDNETYVGQIEGRGKFDVIVIDGTDYGRPPAAMIAREHLNDGGFVILDNSDQCLRSAEILRESGLTQVDFTGFAPCNGYAQTTSIYFDGRYSFKPLGGQPQRSPAQPNPPWPTA